MSQLLVDQAIEQAAVGPVPTESDRSFGEATMALFDEDFGPRQTRAVSTPNLGDFEAAAGLSPG